MNTNNKKIAFRDEDIKWDELATIGVMRDELEMAGELETLLSGEKTGVVSLSIVLMGVDIAMDATLQLIDHKGSPIIEILGVEYPDGEDEE